MKDRYLFKAKRADNGEWVEGHLITDETDDSKCFIGYVIGTDEDGIPHDLDVAQVDPYTICQCTGLKDKNGKLIWENDIVSVIINSGSTICRCAFADTVAQFQLWQKHTIKRTSTVLNLGNYECEVIGNTFDNPELLEV